MQPIIPSLPFLAFPTDKVLAEFRPVRALLVETPTPEGAVRWDMFRSIDDLLKMDLHDPRPMLEAIALEMGYDTAKIAAGEGETGVDGHSWVTYCDARWLPLLVRWQAGDAQLLLTMVETAERGNGVGSDLRLTILGDQAALPILRRLSVALSRFGLTRQGHCHGRTMVDGVFRKMEVPEIAHGRLAAAIRVYGDRNGALSEIRATELPDLMHSCDCSGVRDEWNAQPDGFAEVHLKQRHGVGLVIPADRAISPEMIELIQRTSVQAARNLTTKDLRREYASEEARNKLSSLWLAAQESEGNQQQRAYLAGALLEIDKVRYGENGPLTHPGLSFDTMSLRLGVTSVGDDMRRPAADVFIGAEPKDTPKGMSRGLIELALACVDCGVHMMRDLDPKELANPPKTGWVPPIMKDFLVGQPGTPRARIFKAEKPSFGIHQGLPIAVNYSAVVWRKGDEQSLAIDFAYHQASDGVHLARVTRKRSFREGQGQEQGQR